MGSLFSFTKIIVGLLATFMSQLLVCEEMFESQNSLQEEIKICPSALAPTQSAINLNDDKIYLTDYFAPVYFANLKGDFGDNTKGSCSYVAADMLLSFFDSYWCDDFLPEKFDGPCRYADQTVLNADRSPGSKKESNFGLETTNLTNAEYLALIEEHKDEVLHLCLASIGVEKYGTYDMSSDFPLGTWLRTLRYVILDYLDDFTDLSREAVDVGFANQDASKMRDAIIEKVTSGIPVIVDAVNDKGAAHSFIVYDYDEQNDELYANAGWYDSSYYHVAVSDFGFTRIQEILYLEPKIDHEHSFNYWQMDEEGNRNGVCSCSAVVPTKIEISTNFLDYAPTYTWNSLAKERWHEDIQLHYSLSVLDENKQLAFELDDSVFESKLSLTTEEWARIINDVAHPNYYVYIALVSNFDPYWDDYYCVQEFKEPNRYLSKASFLPSDWGFVGRYYFENELSSDRLVSEPERKNTTAYQNGLTVQTERLRCGYIEESFVVLSPRRQNAGRAYFEMNFSSLVFSFMYRACMWGSSEMLDGTAKIQVKDIFGNWHDFEDISISTLKTRTGGLTQFTEQTPFGIYGLRFETTSSALGTRNKGRLCIADIAFSTMPLDSLSSYVDYDYEI